jgi:cell division protein FtsL
MKRMWTLPGDPPGPAYRTWERTPERSPESQDLGNLLVFRLRNRMNSIRLGEKAVYGGIVVGVIIVAAPIA